MAASAPATAAEKAAEMDAVTFATEPKKIYVPLEETAKRLRWRIQRTKDSEQITLRKVPIPTGAIRPLIDGTELISIEQLAAAGASVEKDPQTGTTTLGSRFRRVNVSVGQKRVEINLAKQQLNAWQGNRLVLQTKISSGRDGRTPTGKFKAGPYKARKHYSSLYNNAPMPWSVQVSGNVFVHGFTSVPDYPASHGCIRVPLTGRNPAKFFYEWINVGTPIAIVKR
ncbi:MAG: L,D-transpeptidase [Verrucomicrobia bacterium]|nr:L,D-transpeptidase [Verrucomicrobiota bacterium]